MFSCVTCPCLNGGYETSLVGFQDRKKKVRDFLGTLNNEKSSLETSVQSLESNLRDAIAAKALCEQQLQLLEMRISKVQEQVNLQ